MSYLEKAEVFVRNHPANKELMGLGFGTQVELKCKSIIEYTVVGRVCGVNDWSDAGDYDHHREKDERNTIQAGYYRGDEYVIRDFTPEKYTILGKPAQLQHYIRVIYKEARFLYYEIGIDMDTDEKLLLVGRGFYLSLTTGKPATEEDARLFLELVEGLSDSE